MDKDIKMEIALDIISSKIVNTLKSGCDVNGAMFNNLLLEKEQVYAFNETVIDKVITVYGKELKNRLNKRGGKNGN